jgi:hypothetical protein
LTAEVQKIWVESVIARHLTGFAEGKVED